MEGRNVNGYTLIRLLGKGGMAEVWYAENGIHKPAAVKILLDRYCGDENIVARFLSEAEIMVKLDHSNIRQVYDYGKLDGRPAIIMEYLEGDDIKARMKRGEKFSLVEIESWWNQMVDALKYTHEQGVIHRDIKPSNIFLDNKRVIKLLDFGIAKIKESVSVTQTGAMMGTLIYMSPEQVCDSKHIDHKTDIYSLAVSFVQIISGKAPYDSTTTDDYNIRKGIVEQPLDLSSIPNGWAGFLNPYLDKNPEQRPELRHFVALNLNEDEGTIVENIDMMKVSSQPRIQKSETIKQESNRCIIRLSKEKHENSLSTKDDTNHKTGWILGIIALIIIVLAGVIGSKIIAGKQTSSINYTTTSYNTASSLREFEVDMSDVPSDDSSVVIDPKKDVKIQLEKYYTKVNDYRDGFYKIFENNKVGLADKTGKIIQSPKYDAIYTRNDKGLIKIELGSKIGYLNIKGVEIIPPIYSKIGEEKDGIILVQIDDKYGFLDAKTMKQKANPIYDFIFSPVNGKIRAIKEGKEMYLNMDGESVETNL